MKIKTYHWTLRATTWVLIAVMIAPYVPVRVQASVALPVSNIPVDIFAGPAAGARRLPPLPRPAVPYVPVFSAAPTDAELGATPLFSEVLLPTRATTPAENLALAAALTAYAGRAQADDQSSLTAFLDAPANASSPWRAALQLNMGIAYSHQGQISVARVAWNNSWQATMARTEPPLRSMADRVFGELVQSYVWTGDYSVAQPLLVGVSNRQFSGGSADMVSSANRGVSAYLTGTQNFLCGVNSLQSLVGTYPATPTVGGILNYSVSQQDSQGTSLFDLQTIAAQNNMLYQMVRRPPGASGPIPPNSVVHWSSGHYSAITTSGSGGVFSVADSGYSDYYGHAMSTTLSTITQESDGYFLIPAGPLPAGWSTVSQTEGETVFGRGSPPHGPNRNDYTPTDCKICPGGEPKPSDPEPDDYDDSNEEPPPGMAAYSAHLMMINLNIVDIPMRYSPPRGPNVRFKASYNHKDIRPEANPTYSNLGPKWTYDWLTYIVDSGTSGNRDLVTRYVSGGGQIKHKGYSGGSYAADSYGAVLQYDSATDSYVLEFPNGSKKVFGQALTQGAGRKVLLSKIEDGHGNALNLYYDALGRLVQINDALGQSTVFHYDLPVTGHAENTYKITSVEDPFGRIARFEYVDGRLSKITDIAGMSSSFLYNRQNELYPILRDPNFITSMTTPYGETLFGYTESDDGGVSSRRLIIRDPDNQYECLLYLADDGDATSPAETAPSVTGCQFETGLKRYRNTYHWDKQAMSELGRFPDGRRDRATAYHWLHDEIEDSGKLYSSGILESMKRPLENRVWYWYEGQRASFRGDISFRKPTVIARLVDDPAGGNAQVTQALRFAYNSHGKVTKITDPINRETSFDYFPNGIDLQYVRQTSNGKDERLAEYGYYAAHLPGVYLDASRQVYQMVWTPFGKLGEFANPKTEVTRLIYDSEGFLKRVERPYQTTKFAYDRCNRLRSVTSSDYYTLTYDYDALDRLVRVTYPDSTFDQYDYSRLDLVRVWDRAKQCTAIAYDNTGRPTTVRDPLGRTTQLTWCGCGGLDSLIDARNKTTRWVRDWQGRVTDKYYADSTEANHFHYEYSASGRLKLARDAKGQTKTFTHYADNTLQSITYSTADTRDVRFTWDPDYRRLATVAQSKAGGATDTTEFKYNPITTAAVLGAGRLASVGPLTAAGAPIPADTVSYGYDSLGRVNSQSINGVGESVSFDFLGRLTSHSTPLGTFTAEYVDGTSRLKSLAFPNGQKTTYGYSDNFGDRNLNWILNKASSGAPISRFDYQHDVLGQITQWTQQTDSNTPQVYKLQHDPVGQLLTAELAPANQAVAKAFTYRYDDAGNRTSEQIDQGSVSSVTTSAYNDANQLLPRTSGGVAAVRFAGRVNEPATVTVNGQPATVKPDPASGTGAKTFSATVNVATGTTPVDVPVVATDLMGNKTINSYRVTAGGNGAQDIVFDRNGNCTKVGDTSYEWDAENRLLAVTNGVSGKRSEFSYDGFGRRVRVVEKQSGATQSTRSYVWSGGRICEERDENNTVTKRFFAEGEQIGGVNYYYTRDHLGSIREMTDVNGVIRARYDYDPYGRRSQNLIQVNPVEASFGFTGHYYHSPSGLSLTWFRAYDPQTGRWLSRDPIGELGGVNLYNYVLNNPGNYVDPDGRVIMWIVGAAVIGLGVFGLWKVKNAVENGQAQAEIANHNREKSMDDISGENGRCPAKANKPIGEGIKQSAPEYFDAATGPGTLGGGPPGPAEGFWDGLLTILSQWLTPEPEDKTK